MTVRRFEELEIWKLARELANEVFGAYYKSDEFRKDFKLKEQINGASGSIMDNIAEGFGRGSKNEFVNFLTYSKGSAAELQSQLYRALDRKYISQEEFNHLFSKSDLIARKIAKFITYLNSSSIQGSKFKNRQPQTQNPKLKTLNPKPKTLNPTWPY